MIVYLFDYNGEYKYPYECQLDPLESEMQNKDVYLQPANSTLIEPPIVAENHKAIWDGVKWNDIDFTPKKEVPKPLSEDEKIQIQIDELKQKLFDTDYQAIKHSENIMTDEEYAPIRQQRQSWRYEINELEKQLNK